MPRARSLLVASDGELTVERDPQRRSGRLLRQAGMDASYVDLADPRHLEFDYLRWARLVLQAFGARHVLHIGGGACALARALLAEDPASRHEVFEVDPAVVAIARAHLGLRRQPGLKLSIADGREALARRADHSADAAVIDAFVGARVPRHLVTAEALARCARATGELELKRRERAQASSDRLEVGVVSEPAPGARPPARTRVRSRGSRDRRDGYCA